MKKVLLTFISLLFIFSVSAQYDENYVEISSVSYGQNSYKMLYMKRGESGKRVKAKYFAAKDQYNGNTVAQRYNEWKRNHDVICVTSGTYMTNYDPKTSIPVGITIDNGILVNDQLAKFDGLVIVYATGGVVASNIENGDLNLNSNGVSQTLDIKKPYDKSKFIAWAKSERATVFQTHLLVYDNQLTVDRYTSSSSSRERRFLAVGHDEEGQVVHCVVHAPDYSSLYEGSRRVLEFLNEFQEMEVIWMINLDTGAQDIFQLFDSNGYINNDIEGERSIDEAVNLLVYYYE